MSLIQPASPEPRLRGRARAMHVLSLHGAERDAAQDAWTVDTANDLLATSSLLPPMPHGAREYVQRVAERKRGNDNGTTDLRAVEQHARWCAQLFEILVVDGLKLARDLIVAGEWELAQRVGERLRAQANTLVGLQLAWWPEIATDGSKPMTLPQHVHRGVDWIARRVVTKTRPKRKHGPSAADDQVRTSFAKTLLGAGLDAIEAERRPAPAVRNPAQDESFQDDPTPVKGGGAIVDPGPNVTETLGDDWEVP